LQPQQHAVGHEVFGLIALARYQGSLIKQRPSLFDTHSKACSLEIADVYKAFEELEVSLDKARNDPELDKVVRLGANRGIFILGKYYAKLDNCEVYAIATSMYFVLPLDIGSHSTHVFTSLVLTPTLGYRWFKKNAAWPEEWKDLPLKKIRER